jgi:glycosyltransferase involved in cell wall biosynthesis
MKYLKTLSSDTKFYITPYSPPLKSLLHLDEIEDSPEFKLLIPGQLIERKGIINFLQSLSTFLQKNKQAVLLKLRIVGSGPLESQLQTYINHSKFSLEHIQFVPYEEMPLQYQWADVVVFSTFYDEWGLVVNEALAAARPVMGSIYGQASIELVEHGKNGILYDPLDAESVDKALSMLFSLNKMQLAQMGALGRNKVMEISPDIVASTMQRGIGTLIA